MQALILAGGLGTRMREETEFRPKPMVEVGGRPVLWHIMKNFAMAGISDFVIATGYRSEDIKDYFLSYHSRNHDVTVALDSPRNVVVHGQHEEGDWRVTIAFTGEDTSTGGRILRASKYLTSDPFVVAYGDGLANVLVSDVLSFHRQNQALVTLTSVQPRSRFGVLEISPDDLVTRFAEKPTLDGWISIGFFIMQQSALDYLDESSALEGIPLQNLTKDGKLAAYRHTGFWQPMDTYREALLLNQLWASGEAPWKLW